MHVYRTTWSTVFQSRRLCAVLIDYTQAMGEVLCCSLLLISGMWRRWAALPAVFAAGAYPTDRSPQKQVPRPRELLETRLGGFQAGDERIG